MKAVQNWIIGIDEVGRGALAGPVVVAVAALRQGFIPKNRVLGKLKDSKKLSARQREAWCKYFMKDPQRIFFALARVYPRQIEKHNISKAANIAAERALRRLWKDISGRTWGTAHASKTTIFLDGGLFLGNGEQPKNAKTIIKGDEKIAAIKIASIIAKVYRDQLMRRLAKKYPAYGFEVHKGYGTKVHRTAVKKHGPSSAHRLTFLGKSSIIKQ